MKLKEILKREAPPLVLLAVPFLVLIPLWDKFPPRVAIHWGIDGKPNGWADKSWGLLLLPLTNVGLYLLLAFLTRFDSIAKKQSVEAQASLQRVLRIISLVNGIFFASVALMVDAVALGWKLDVLRLVTLGMLALFVVLGNYLPKLRPNRFIGIRTPWTMKSPEVWARTHRVFGSIMFIGSLVLILPCLLLPSPVATLVFLAFTLFVSIGSMIYSYQCYRTTEK